MAPASRRCLLINPYRALTRAGTISHEPASPAPTESLYSRLGGYDAIAAVASDLIQRLMSDPLLGRYWKHRGEDGLRREQQLLIDFLCASAGGPVLYVGRDMPTSHRGMGISEDDWQRFLEHLRATLTAFDVPARETSEVLTFIESTKGEIVES